MINKREIAIVFSCNSNNEEVAWRSNDEYSSTCSLVHVFTKNGVMEQNPSKKTELLSEIGADVKLI
jgi:hypothetical protein